jgi:hypothetical protein
MSNRPNNPDYETLGALPPLRLPNVPRGGGLSNGKLSIIHKNEIKDFCLEVLRSDEYKASIKARAVAGSLGQMEPLLWYYGYGKPKERVEISTPAFQDKLADLPPSELADRAAAIADYLNAMAQGEDLLGEIVNAHEDPQQTDAPSEKDQAA